MFMVKEKVKSVLFGVEFDGGNEVVGFDLVILDNFCFYWLNEEFVVVMFVEYFFDFRNEVFLKYDWI